MPAIPFARVASFSLIAVLGCFACEVKSAAAQEPGWVPRIIKTEEERIENRSTPIVERPYRPFHFYGNTVRRQYYRGNPLPSADDLVNSGRSVISWQPQWPSLPSPSLPSPAWQLPPLPIPSLPIPSLPLPAPSWRGSGR